MVEHRLAKARVASSNLVSRSMVEQESHLYGGFLQDFVDDRRHRFINEIVVWL
ncbi:hypothetical protein FTV88_2994 [Heliorestis convoluta]|uniref:Uncharacterized protein n=1 Tax=Heliorestis convoluta TaxID=356322 RepID=A0A5Q2N6S0_9FIRM|nr:hypothetical protein FTV88_2994 [Heliorestis convoluta]